MASRRTVVVQQRRPHQAAKPVGFVHLLTEGKDERDVRTRIYMYQVKCKQLDDTRSQHDVLRAHVMLRTHVMMNGW